VTVYDIVDVAVAPPKIFEADLVKKVAATVNKDLYTTRLLLAGKIPRIIAHYQTMQEAQSVAYDLRALGLVALVFSDSELHKTFPSSFRAHTLKLGKGEVIFLSRGGESKTMNADDVFLILKGTIQTTPEKETAKTRKELNLAATLLTGGIPIWRKVREKTKDASIQTEDFVRLYDRMSPGPSVEIYQFDFDYSFLGYRLASSSLVNLSKIVMSLRSTFPQAIFDYTLTAPFDDTEVNCRLIYLYHQAVSGFSPLA